MKCTYCKNTVPKGEVVCPHCNRTIAISKKTTVSFWVILILMHFAMIPLLLISVFGSVFIRVWYFPEYVGSSTADDWLGLFVVAAILVQFATVWINAITYFLVDRGQYSWKKGYDVLMKVPMVLYIALIVVICAFICFGCFDGLSVSLAAIGGLVVQIILFNHLRKLKQQTFDLETAAAEHEEKSLGRFNL